MIKSEELANPNSCLNQAADDEPIFVLRANDPLAPTKVVEWAQAYRQLKQRVNRGPLTPPQEEKYRESVESAEEMQAWNVDHGKTAHEEIARAVEPI